MKNKIVLALILTLNSLFGFSQNQIRCTFIKNGKGFKIHPNIYVFIKNGKDSSCVRLQKLHQNCYLLPNPTFEIPPFNFKDSVAYPTATFWVENKKFVFESINHAAKLKKNISMEFRIYRGRKGRKQLKKENDSYSDFGVEILNKNKYYIILKESNVSAYTCYGFTKLESKQTLDTYKRRVKGGE